MQYQRHGCKFFSRLPETLLGELHDLLQTLLPNRYDNTFEKKRNNLKYWKFYQKIANRNDLVVETAIINLVCKTFKGCTNLYEIYLQNKF